MPAPRHIVDALECVVTVYFSNARQNLRAAFILCDSLVELTCREKVKVTVPTPGKLSFKEHLKHAAVGLDPATVTLGRTLEDTHKLRNNYQHDNPSAMPDVRACADAILDCVTCIDHCFPGAQAGFPEPVKVTLRIVRLFSTGGDGAMKGQFIRKLREHSWRGDQRNARLNELIIDPGERSNWSILIPM